jgi:hypothetical protein
MAGVWRIRRATATRAIKLRDEHADCWQPHAGAAPVTLEELRGSLESPKPPAGLGKPLEALWHAGRGEWARAHRIVMSAKSRDAAWVHAFLHRQEGDRDNARYWYRQAKRPEFEGSLEDEWMAMAGEMLGRGV